MTMTKLEAQAKLDKLAANPDTFQFALSPGGFLLIKHTKVFEVADFMLYYDGNYYRRNGFDFSTDITLTDNGLFLCSYCKGKLIAKTQGENFEFATWKKPLTEDFSLVISMRFGGKIVLFIADGKFAGEAFFVTLTDTPSNGAFAAAMVRSLVGVHNPKAASMLLSEEDNNGEEA